MSKKIVVIGGVACGPKAAARVKRLDPECQVTVIERGKDISYGACGLPFYLEGQVKDVTSLTTTPVGIPRNSGFFRAVKGVEVLTETEALAIDRKRKKVLLKNRAGSEEELSYDKLVLATGSKPVKPPIEGIDLKGIHCLKTLEDGKAIKDGIENSKSKKAVIVGGGLIGMECVEPLVKAGFEVHVVEKLDWVLPTLLDYEMAVPLMKHLASKGVHIHCGEEVIRFVGDEGGRVAKVETANGVIEADLVILAIGVRPNTELAQEAGLEVTRMGIKVDSHLRTSDPDIYAGGDCVASYNLVTGGLSYFPMGSLANKHGRIIGNNLAGFQSTFSGACGTAVCHILGFNVARTGLTEREARDGHGLGVVTALTPGPDRPHYMKDAKPIHLKLIAEEYSGRVIGAQLLGPGEVLSKVDTVAALILKNGTVDDLTEVDMAYAPPFSSAMDNIIVAANIIQNKMDGVATAYSPKKLKEKLEAGDDFVMLDVRTPKEVEAMKLPYENVVYIPLGKLREKASELPKDKEIVPLCKISLRGYEAQKILEAQGFESEKINFLDGGIVAWPYEKIVKG